MEVTCCGSDRCVGITWSSVAPSPSCPWTPQPHTNVLHTQTCELHITQATKSTCSHLTRPENDIDHSKLQQWLYLPNWPLVLVGFLSVCPLNPTENDKYLIMWLHRGTYICLPSQSQLVPPALLCHIIIYVNLCQPYLTMCWRAPAVDSLFA